MITTNASRHLVRVGRDRHQPALPPAAGTAGFRVWATALGHELAARGARPIERQLVALAHLARLNQVAAVSSSVLADRRQPEVARTRAFFRVVTALIELVPATPASEGAVA